MRLMSNHGAKVSRCMIGHRPDEGANVPAGWSMIVLCATLVLPSPEAGHAQAFLEDTELAGFRFGSSLSDTVRAARRTGYELSDGTPIDMSQWYGSRWTDLGFTFVTRIDPTFGIYWGFSTGERGEKYVIRPSLKFGFVKLFELSEEEVISLSATAVIGGGLRERTCAADYGAIGGTQVVNCRLAASILPPAETLDYLFDGPPPDQLEIAIRYTRRF